MAKRANGEGTIRQREDGLWEARYRDADGQRKSFYSKSQTELAAKLRGINHQISTGEYCNPSKLTVGTWMLTWWKEYCVPATRSNSAATTRQSIDNHIMPLIGKYLLQKLRVDQVQRFVNQLSKQYAPSTVKRIMAALKSGLKQAVQNKLIPHSPTDYVRMPQQGQKEIQYLTKDQQRLLIEQLPENTDGRALRFMMGTGLRVSELIGLRWKDIEGDVFSINQAITTYSDCDSKGVKTKQIIGEPKSKASKRSIPLSIPLQAVLKEQREGQRKQKETALGKGIGWPDSDLVFCTDLGYPKDRANLKRALDVSLALAGLPHRGPHALRHTFATNAVQANVDPVTVSNMLGHSKVAFTMQTYVHTNMDVKRQGIEAMEEAMKA